MERTRVPNGGYNEHGITRELLEPLPESLTTSIRDCPERTFGVLFAPPEVLSDIRASLSLLLSRRPAPRSAAENVWRGCSDVAEDIAERVGECRGRLLRCLRRCDR